MRERVAGGPFVAAALCALLALGVRAGRPARGDWFAQYRALEEIEAHVDDLVARHPAEASVRTLGTTGEGRPIRAVTISRGGKLGVALVGGQHAREWVSVMTATCIADRLLESDDPRIGELLGSVTFYIVPVANPDGYVYSWTTDRYWRKNRRGGYGVDLNRNYSVAWGKAGSSADPRASNYRGSHPFSEPETRALRTLFETAPIRAAVDFHAYSQVIVYPWSYQRTPPPDAERFAALADRMGTAMRSAHDVPYAIRPGSSLKLGASGTLGDWAYAEHGVLAFLVELRPSSGDPGFELPPDQIAPTCDEGMAAVLALAEALHD